MHVAKLKTKVVATEKKYHKGPVGPDARENAGDQVAIGFSLDSDWPRKWREFSRPIIERRKAKLQN